MGAHSSLCITLQDARLVYRALVGDPSEMTKEHLEQFFDKALDVSLYNCVVIDSHYSPDFPDAGAQIRWLTEQYLLEHPVDRPDPMTAENQLLRYLLAIRVAGPTLYTDDGELQDNSVQPFIDFKRDTAVVIQSKIRERGQRKMEASLQTTGVVMQTYYSPTKYVYTRDENLHHGRFLFRHKGKRKKGKPNYPPTKMLVKTGRRWSKSKRGCRKLWKAEDRLRGWGRPDPRKQRLVVKAELISCQMFTRKGPVGNVMAAREPVLRESQS